MNAPTTITRMCVEVLELRSQGMTVAEMAEHLGTNEKTVGSRLVRATQRLGAKDSFHAVALAMASGLIAGPEPIPCVAVEDRYKSVADFTEDFKLLRARGLTRAQIAQKLQIKLCTLDKRLAAARRLGLLPRRRRAAHAQR